MTYSKRLALLASTSGQSQILYRQLTQEISPIAPSEADIIVVLGGDGFMLHTLHKLQSLNKPVYGINCGTVGFLMNSPVATGKDLLERLEKAEPTVLHPLRMEAITQEGKTFTHHAINEVSLLRQTHQAAKIRIIINSITRLDNLVGDGVIVATPAGSTAYNFSAHGPILPLGSPLLALTPLSAFRPRHWRGALLPNTAKVRFEIVDADHRSVSATADDQTVNFIKCVDICQDVNVGYTLLFDPGHNLEERILKEQFVTF